MLKQIFFFQAELVFDVILNSKDAGVAKDLSWNNKLRV